MTPKEKAKELVCKMWGSDNPDEYDNILKFSDDADLSDAKLCALICVDEILRNYDTFDTSGSNTAMKLIMDDEDYWQEVKTEINKIEII